MSWESVVKKATTSRTVKLIWPSMKKLIDNFFSEEREEYFYNDLKTYLIDNIRTQFEEDNPSFSQNKISLYVSPTLKHLQVTGGRSKYMDSKVPKYIRAKYNRRRWQSNRYGETYELIDGIKKSWDLTLKGSTRSSSQKAVEETVKFLIEKFSEGKDEFTSTELKEYIIHNLKTEHIKRNTVDGKISTHTSSAPTRYITNKLTNAMKSKIPIWVKKHGYNNRHSSIPLNPYTIFRKSDSWESMIDSMIAEDKLFEEIYDAILRKFKFSSPSKEKVIAYLNANYKRHTLFSNKWSTKSEGDDQ